MNEFINKLGPLNIAILIVTLFDLIVIIRICFQLRTYKKLTDRKKELDMNLRCDQSQNILNYIRTFTAQVAIIKFNEFVDSRNLDKVTKQNTETLISDISKTVHASLRTDLINFDGVLFTKEFMEMYIVQTAVNLVKKLLDNKVDEVGN